MKFYAGIGSRDTPDRVIQTIQRIARNLEREGFTLRSGGAHGADAAFASVVKKAQIWLPWDSYNKEDHNPEHDIRVIQSNDLAAFQSVLKYHPSKRLTQGILKLMARNYRQLIGLNEPDSLFVVAYTMDGMASGGTGQAIRIANDKKIPVFNLFLRDAETGLEDFLKGHRS